MDLRPLLLVPVLALGMTACSSAKDAVDSVNNATDKVRDCTSLANDVLASGFNGTPSQTDIDQAKERLDVRVDQLKNEQVKQAAASLRDKVDQLQVAVRSKDQAQVQAKLTEVRDAAKNAASACNIPVGTFLGSS